MSRAKHFNHNGEDLWFDYGARATPEQLVTLADYEEIDLDDLLDEGLSQKEVARRLFEATSAVVPAFVLERRRIRLSNQGKIPACRICSVNGWECEGYVTRHHFVPRWLMRMLENYQAYASRTICTIPICVGRHRDLHFRSENDPPKSIVPYLRDHERKFAHKMLDELKAQIPAPRWDLLAGGDEHSYEGQLIRDYLQGHFASAENAYDLPELVSINPSGDVTYSQVVTAQ